RNFARGIYPTTARRRNAASRSAAARRADPLPADPDDQPGGNPGVVPTGARHRAGGADAATAGDHGYRWIDGQYALYSSGDSGRLPGAGAPQAAAGASDCPYAYATHGSCEAVIVYPLGEPT